jgi:hypothetical protein
MVRRNTPAISGALRLQPLDDDLQEQLWPKPELNYVNFLEGGLLCAKD